MNIIYAETDLGQIRDAREKALVAVPGTRIEQCKEVIRYVALLGLSMEGGYLVLCNALRLFGFRLIAEIGNSLRVYIAMAVFLYVIISYAIYHLLCLIVPLRTPCKMANEANRIFYADTEWIEDAVSRQDGMRKFVKDADASFVLNENELEITIQRETYREMYTIRLSEETIVNMREKGVLDFTYIDSAWQKAMSRWLGKLLDVCYKKEVKKME